MTIITIESRHVNVLTNLYIHAKSTCLIRHDRRQPGVALLYVYDRDKAEVYDAIYKAAKLHDYDPADDYDLSERQI